MSPSSARRTPDRERPDRPLLQWLAVYQAVGPLLLGVFGFVGGRYQSSGARLEALEHAERVDVVRDSISILDRTANAAAISLLGRSDCLQLGERQGTTRGLPCAVLLAGGAWPLLHAPSGATPTASDARNGTPATVAELALTALLVPAVPRLH